MQSIKYESSMRAAIELARSAEVDEVPIAAILLDKDGNYLYQAVNQSVATGDPTRHAEMLVLENMWRIDLRAQPADCTLIVTLEPCPMCAWAIRRSSVGTLVFGAFNSNYGAAGSVLDLLRDVRLGRRVVEVIGGVLREDCASLVKDSFVKLRDNR